MKFTPIHELKNNVLDWSGLVLYDNLYNLIHYNQQKAPDTWKQIVCNTLKMFEQTYPLVMGEKKFPQLNDSKHYQFVSNFQSYLNGEITEDEIELVPKAIYYIRGWINTNSQWWKYDSNTGIFTSRLFNVNASLYSYCASYPTVWEKENSGDWNNNSGIYFLDADKDEFFRKFLIYYTLKHIKAINTSNQLNQNIKFLEGIDDLLSVAKEEMEFQQKTRSRIFNMWRK